MEGTNRVTVLEAARILGISEGAVRARIHRGSLETEREDGTVYVRLDVDNTANERAEQSELVQALREHNTTLQRQLDAEREASSELRRIIAALTQRIPEIEAPGQESRETPVSGASPGPSDAPAEGARGSQTAREQLFTEGQPERPEERSWWRRVFGG